MSEATSIPDAPVRDEATTGDEKPPKVEKVPFRGENDPKITEPRAPEGFNPKIHKGLSKGDFESDLVYLEYRAIEHETKAAELRKEIETLKKLGNATDRAKTKKLLSMQQRMAELARELAEGDSSVDLASLLGADQAAALLGTPKAE